jgi:medium-chain acyl-[acyl-carrier-protein] hydrolase
MYTFEGKIRYSETDRTGHLNVPGVADYFQDCSVFQSEELGVGVSYLAQKNRASGFDKIYGTRNFTMKSMEDEMLAYANSIWVYVDAESGRPVSPDEEEIRRYQPEAPLPMEYEKRKVKPVKEWEDRPPVHVKRQWIDSNGHVNNSRYIKAAYNEIPEGMEIHQIRAEYKKQALEGDVLYPRYGTDHDRIVIALCDEEQKPYAMVEFR